MRPSNKSRSRNKSGNNPNRRPNIGNIVNRVFESAGPDGKVRGTPQQIIDKYQALARDAQVSGDRVAAENYSQHAEHYTRLLGEAQRHMPEGRERDERDEREEGGDFQPRDRDDRFQQPPREPRFEPREPRPDQAVRQPEPTGLTTLGADDADDTGPVETPEEAARRRAEAAEPLEARAPMANGGEPTVDEPRPEEPRPEGGKRPRTRRKAKTVIQTAEAGAE